MATYLKRTSKLFDISLNQASSEMNLRDVICPICRGILIEPVTLPCTHNLCLRCLKGTFEHNSLSCPLCRIRVGSWLRSATKSETLVNNELWDLIKTRFPKEIQSKHGDGDDGTSHNVYPPKIISAAGEIRREYEMQLQIAEEEIRRQREAEIMANEALIRKFQEEEQQKLAQYAQDQLLAKSLAKKQLLSKDKGVKMFNNCVNIKMPSNEVEILPLSSSRATGFSKRNEDLINEPYDARKPAKQLLDAAHNHKLMMGNNKKTCCQASVHSVVTLKNQLANYAEPSCSKIYGTRSEEELRVPSDVLSSNKKSLGIEICVTTVKDDDNKRIGSAESAGSHDSINQEIHHFKPIKAAPRTPLRLTHDGRQIDPKLIRVIPIIERVTNAVPKPPSPSHFRRIVGCSWSAFREFLITGKTQQNLHQEDYKPLPSTLAQSYTAAKPTKPETVRKIDLAQDISFDSNKNYTKNINRIINGTKVSKKLVLEDETDGKSSKSSVKNGLLEKLPKKLKNSEDEDSSSSFHLNSNQSSDESGAAIENIAERIKRRKVTQIKKNEAISDENSKQFPSPRKTRSRNVALKPEDADPPPSAISKRKTSAKVGTKAKRLRVQFNNETEIIESRIPENFEAKPTKSVKKAQKSKAEEAESLDDAAILEQEKMEKLLLQEKQDFELAQRLQAQFNEMERISGRTRRSKRALEGSDLEAGIGRMRINGVSNAAESSGGSKSRRRQKKD